MNQEKSVCNGMTREDLGRRAWPELTSEGKPSSTVGTGRASAGCTGQGRSPQGGAARPLYCNCWRPRAKSAFLHYWQYVLFLPTQILGVAIKFGKFSVKENKQLEKNVQEFLSLTGIENADKLLYTDRYPEEKSMITDLKRKYSFRLHIGKFATVHSLILHSLPTLNGWAMVRIQQSAWPIPCLRCMVTAAMVNSILLPACTFGGLECVHVS